MCTSCIIMHFTGHDTEHRAPSTGTGVHISACVGRLVCMWELTRSMLVYFVSRLSTKTATSSSYSIKICVMLYCTRLIHLHIVVRRWPPHSHTHTHTRAPPIPVQCIGIGEASQHANKPKQTQASHESIQHMLNRFGSSSTISFVLHSSRWWMHNFHISTDFVFILIRCVTITMCMNCSVSVQRSIHGWNVRRLCHRRRSPVRLRPNKTPSVSCVSSSPFSLLRCCSVRVFFFLVSLTPTRRNRVIK